MTKIGDSVWISRNGCIWDTLLHDLRYAPYTEARLVAVEDSLPVVLDRMGMDSLGATARVTPADGLTGVYARAQDGRWYNTRNPDTTYPTRDFGFDGDGWIVLDEGASVEPEPVIEPTAYGAQVEFDGKDGERVIAYRLSRHISPWNVLYDGYKWDGYPWSYIAGKNPKIIKEG